MLGWAYRWYETKSRAEMDEIVSGEAIAVLCLVRWYQVSTSFSVDSLASTKAGTLANDPAMDNPNRRTF